MNMVSLCGGLGNQMFQYAFGSLLGGRVAFDISWFEKSHPGVTRREFGLCRFNCRMKLVNGEELMNRKRDCRWRHLMGRRPPAVVQEDPANVYDERYLCARNSLVRGYFQSARYYDGIRGRLLRDFTLRRAPEGGRWERLLADIRSSRSVSLHIRRGDYLNHPDLFPTCEIDYYLRAAHYIAARSAVQPRLFVFSDDLAWARKNLVLPYDMVFVDLSEYGRAELDMMAMRECSCNVIANSTYSWWGAWLNGHPEKIVVSPTRDFFRAQPEILPKGWVQL